MRMETEAVTKPIAWLWYQLDTYTVIFSDSLSMLPRIERFMLKKESVVLSKVSDKRYYMDLLAGS